MAKEAKEEFNKKSKITLTDKFKYYSRLSKPAVKGSTKDAAVWAGIFWLFDWSGTIAGAIISLETLGNIRDNQKLLKQKVEWTNMAKQKVQGSKLHKAILEDLETRIVEAYNFLDHATNTDSSKSGDAIKAIKKDIFKLEKSAAMFADDVFIIPKEGQASPQKYKIVNTKTTRKHRNPKKRLKEFGT